MVFQAVFLGVFKNINSFYHRTSFYPHFIDGETEAHTLAYKQLSN